MKPLRSPAQTLFGFVLFAATFSGCVGPAYLSESVAAPSRPRPGCRDLQKNAARAFLCSSTGPVRFAQVDAMLYRGGQPSAAQLQRLAALGVGTVISLRREDHAMVQRERANAQRLGLRFVHFPFYGVFGVDRAFVAPILRELSRKKPRATYVHCKLGRDRTSLIVALLRVYRDRWPPRRAWRHEALRYGYRPTFFLQRIASSFHTIAGAYRREASKRR